jgi:uncharacterized protein (DUF697 family)
MTKKLPKAIGRTIDDLRRNAAGARAEIVRAANDQDAAAKPSPPPASESAEPEAALPAVRPETLPVPVPPAPVPAQIAAPPAPTDPDLATYKAMLRRARARELIERHAKYAAVGGLIPLPILDVAGVTAIIVRMARELARLYEVPAQRDRMRAIVLGLLGGTAPVGIGAILTSGAMRFVPGVNVLNMAVTSIAAAACTRSIGLIFLEHFESGRTLLDFEVERKAAD